MPFVQISIYITHVEYTFDKYDFFSNFFGGSFKSEDHMAIFNSTRSSNCHYKSWRVKPLFFPELKFFYTHLCEINFLCCYLFMEKNQMIQVATLAWNIQQVVLHSLFVSWAKWSINTGCKSTNLMSHQILCDCDYCGGFFVYIQTHCMDTVYHTLWEDSLARNHPDTLLGNVIFNFFPSAKIKSVG